MNHYVVKQTSGKRFLAAFFDVIFIGLLSLLTYVPILYITNYAGWGSVAFQMYNHGLRSGLYAANELEGLNEINDNALLPKALYTFYVDTFDDDGNVIRGFAPLLVDEAKAYNSVEDYYVVILKKGSAETLFDFSTDPAVPYEVPVLAGKSLEARSFYQQEIRKAHTLFNEHPDILPLYAAHYRFMFLTLGGAYLSAAFILIVLLPLFLRDKVTLGKVVTKTIVLNKIGFKMTKTQAFFRNLALFFFSYVFFFMPFHIISFLLNVFTKNEASLYDRLAATLVADKKTTLVFNDAYDEAVYRKELAGQLLEIERRKAEGQAERDKEKRH